MIEATCAACGTVNRMAEADVPAGAKFVTCSSCKSRVVLPVKTVFGAPMPKPPAIPSPARPKTPPPIPVPVTGKREPVIDLADLPAPKRTTALSGAEGSKPAPKSALADLEADLPTPKGRAKAPSASPMSLDLDDMEPADLPAPKGPFASTISDLPTPKGPTASAISDLPAPKGRSALADLPSSRPKASSLPSVNKPAPPSAPTLVDPQTVRGGAEISDLPTPKVGISDLPMPKPNQGSTDLPAPKGFFDDLPQPAKNQPGAMAGGPPSRQAGPNQPTVKNQTAVGAGPTNPGSTDLPAPKGFFDDLPQPVYASSPAKPDLPAPLGFFDDLPQPAKPNQQGVANLPAPKGFFDDLPQPASSTPTRQGFLDDVPRAPAAGAGNVAGNPHSSADLFGDLPPPSRPAQAPNDMSSSDLLGLGKPKDFELALPPAPDALELEPSSAPELDLGPHAPGAGMAFNDLDLSAPSTPPSRQSGKEQPPATGIKIKPSAKTDPAARSAATAAATAKPSELALELEGEHPAEIRAPKPPSKRELAAAAAIDSKVAKKKRTKLVLGGVLGLAVAGAAGFYVYQRHAAAQARQDEIAVQIKKARTALDAPDPGHWQRAASAAKSVLELDDANADALGLGAEALLAGGIEGGAAGKLAQGRKMINDALAANVTGQQLNRARALAAIAAGQGDAALGLLGPLLAKAPSDAYLLIYQGWAQAAKGDGAAAIAAYDKAIAANAAVKVPALYARGRAKLVLGDLDGARADFTDVLKDAKDHIPAMVGLASALPPAQTSQRESDLLAILQRKDIASADPRTVVQAWTLAADVARQGGRLDVARERYHKALDLTPIDVAALTGLAAVELRDGKIEISSGWIQKALAQAPDDPDAQLIAAEIEIKQGKLVDALARIQKLSDKVPPLPPIQKAHLQMAIGKLREAQGDDDAAADAYTLGAQAAGELDLAPTMAAVTKLGVLAKKALDAKNSDAADGYRKRADQLLSSIAARAAEDAQLSMTIGIAYLEAGDPGKAEGYLRKAVEMRGTDIEAKLALAKALARNGHPEDALAQLDDALAIDKNRVDIALELATTLEAAGRTDDAAAAYDKLLSAAEVPIPARVRAGRFFARNKRMAKAITQAEPILAGDPDNSAGHYLRGEGLLAAGKLDDARKELQLAVDADPDARYLDAQGRAAEASDASTGDTKYQDLALHAYTRATEADPKLFNPWAGMGRLYVKRKEFEKAVAPLTAAYKLDPNSADVMFDFGRTYSALQQKDTAITWFKKSVSIKPRGEAYYLLGILDVDTNHARETLTHFGEATRLGGEEEKASSAPVPWLTDAWFQLGRAHIYNHDDCGAKRPYQVFLSRNPPESSNRREASEYVGTVGRGC